MEKKLRSGYTTGTCAAAAAQAAVWRLCGGEVRSRAEILTRKGAVARLSTALLEETDSWVRFGVVKDAGDDPDVTDGALICVRAERAGSIPSPCWYASEDHPGIYIDGGEGVGRVTRPGLSCPVGKAAINPIPREMIWEAAEQARTSLGYEAPILVTVEIPGGSELAERTFNGKLGILGGLSVLGTTGIVEPMSEAALIATIRLELHMKAVEGCTYPVITPGNYGEAFLRDQLGISLEQGVKCSNFVRETVTCMADEGFRRGLFAGHVGKLIKAAGGVENTHSRYGDRRMEILWDCVRQAVPETEEDGSLGQRILGANTTEEALGLLEERGIRRQTGDLAAALLQEQILQWTGGRLKLDIVMFSSELGIFGTAGSPEGRNWK